MSTTYYPFQQSYFVDKILLFFYILKNNQEKLVVMLI